MVAEQKIKKTELFSDISGHITPKKFAHFLLFRRWTFWWCIKASWTRLRLLSRWWSPSWRWTTLACHVTASTAGARDVHVRLSRDSVWDQIVCHLWVGRQALWHFLFVSTYGIIFMTFDRYCAVIYPIWYNGSVSNIMCRWCFLWRTLVIGYFAQQKCQSNVPQLRRNSTCNIVFISLRNQYHVLKTLLTQFTGQL